MVVDFRLAFRWRNSPGWWSLTAAAIGHAHRNTRHNAVVLPGTHKLMNHVMVDVPLRRRAVHAPVSITVPSLTAAYKRGYFLCGRHDQCGGVPDRQ